MTKSQRRLNSPAPCRRRHRKPDAPPFEAVKAYATLGEICDALRQPFGVYQEVAIT